MILLLMLTIFSIMLIISSISLNLHYKSFYYESVIDVTADNISFYQLKLKIIDEIENTIKESKRDIKSKEQLEKLLYEYNFNKVILGHSVYYDDGFKYIIAKEKASFQHKYGFEIKYENNKITLNKVW